MKYGFFAFMACAGLLSCGADRVSGTDASIDSTTGEDASADSGACKCELSTPAGWMGPFVLAVGTAADLTQCPAALPTKVFEAQTGGAQDCSWCPACPAPTGCRSDAIFIENFQNATCERTPGVTSAFSFGSLGCTAAGPSESPWNYFRLRAQATCPARSGPPPTPPPSLVSKALGCGPAIGGKPFVCDLATCTVAAPAPFNGHLCVAKAGENERCPRAFPSKRTFFEDAIDAADCDCSCSGTCTGGSVTLFSNADCTGSQVAAGACAAFPFPFRSASVASFGTASPSCEPARTPIRNRQPTGPLTVCCQGT